MTEMEIQSPPSSDVSSQPAVSSESYSAPVKEERTFRQEEVNRIVGKAKSEAVESYRRKQVEQPEYVQQKYGDSPQPNPNYANPANSEDHIRKLAAEEAQRHIEGIRKDALQQSQNEAAQRTVNNFYNKISVGKEKYEDFEKVTGDIEYANFPNVVQLLADHLDNSDDVLYELGKNRMNMNNLEMLANRSPRDAIVEAKRLAQSIKDRDVGKQKRLPNEPLSQMRPSNQGVGSGPMTVTDFRAKYKG